MLSGGPNYTSLLIGALLGFGLLYLSVSVRKILTRRVPTESVEDKPALDPSGRLNVRFALGGTQALLMLCIVLSVLPLVFGFRNTDVSWKGFVLLLLFSTMLGVSIVFALKKKDLAWLGNWVDPTASRQTRAQLTSGPAVEEPSKSDPAPAESGST